MRYIMFIIGYVFLLIAVWVAISEYELFFSIIYLMVFFLCASLSYMEFEREEFDVIYNIQHCLKLRRKEMATINNNEMTENFLPSSGDSFNDNSSNSK